MVLGLSKQDSLRMWVCTYGPACCWAFLNADSIDFFFLLCLMTFSSLCWYKVVKFWCILCALNAQLCKKEFIFVKMYVFTNRSSSWVILCDSMSLRDNYTLWVLSSPDKCIFPVGCDNIKTAPLGIPWLAYSGGNGIYFAFCHVALIN